jgi:hypothetical protein
MFLNEAEMNGLPDPAFANSMNNLPANNPIFATGQPMSQMLPPPTAAAGKDISRPSSVRPIDKAARDQYYLIAADPAGSGDPEERLRKLLKAKHDAGMLKPFNYVKGYARMHKYLEQHVHYEARQRILKQLQIFRPKFRERMQGLTDIQLVYVETSFERNLMEYDRIFSSIPIPACCWRRTGEIYRGNKEMAKLIHVRMDQLRDVRYELYSLIVELLLIF